MKMPTISPAVRVSFGLLLFTLSVLLIADLLGIIPKKEALLLEARKKVCESLAVQLSIAASIDNDHILDETLRSFVSRNDDVLAASMSRENGEVVIEHGEFQHFDPLKIDVKKSSENFVVIPIYDRTKPWGSVNVEFSGISNSVLDMMTESIFGLLLFVAITSITGYIFILRKTLHVLDPKAVVPERVRTAFNALAEGVLILDDKEQIMMANDAFAKQLDKEPDVLVGAKASTLKWKLRRSEDEKQLPWINSLESGAKKIGVALNLSTPHMGVRSMSSNSAPILDDAGKMRGALVTFDDITDVEESNVLLEIAVSTLQKNDAEIRRKNNELEILASRDSLTGCYNRRAFFDLIEDMYRQATKKNTDLVCIMADIDHFKSINDRFGHSVGDEAIRIVSEVLNTCSYEGVVVGRYGGEEFCVALPDTDLSKGKEIAEILRCKIKSATKDFCGNDVTITASFGVADLENGMKDISQLLDHADKALYKAKQSGRDRVVIWVQADDPGYEIGKDNSNVQKLKQEGASDYSEHTGGDDVNVQLLQRKIADLESEIQNRESEYSKSRFNDPVTELPTRIIFEDRVNQAMAYAARSDKILAVAILNIGMFSRINTTLGQVVGDEFLKAVGQRLKTILRRSDTVASLVTPGQTGPSLSRFHDDQFALLLTGVDDVDSLTYIIKRVQEKFSGKLIVSDNELYVATTIGISFYPSDGSTANELIQNAHSAEKHAGSMAGRNNYMFFSQEINRKIVDQMKLEIDMHNAIEKDQFRLIYQPKVKTISDGIETMEALIRWDHPINGLLTPKSFISIAEKSGLVTDIGIWCLNAVCKQARSWVEAGANNLRVSVNISAFEFENDNFVEIVKQVLKDNELDAAHLEIELTETTVINDLVKSAKTIDELRYIGVTVTLDDFGTGYSSFSYLGHLNFDWIKIDRSFLLDAVKHRRSQTLYGGMVSMAHEIGLKVVAEGIENQDEYSFVKKLGVDEMQGYMMSKPLDVDSMTRVLFTNINRRKRAS